MARIKLEVYSSYARWLNFHIAQHPEKRGLFNDVIRLAAQRMKQENGHGNAYPITVDVTLDVETKAALVQLARGSKRSRWAFLTNAARDVLRREGLLP